MISITLGELIVSVAPVAAKTSIIRYAGKYCFYQYLVYENDGSASRNRALENKMKRNKVIVIGGGLAGSEAALQLAIRGIGVELYEMRPKTMTEAHTSEKFAELVCSNSFGSAVSHSASGILKTELTELGALVLERAFFHRVPAGASLAVDREKFAGAVTEEICSHPEIEIHREELTEIPTDRVCIVATGPLSSPALIQSLSGLVGDMSLYFYDAISPIVSAESLDLEKMFWGNRYGKGETADFLNIPLDKSQYETLVNDLLTGDVVLPHNFEEEKYFESCMPIEAIAARGPRTLAFGPLKPVGLSDPKRPERAHAVIQLRAENKYKTAFNLVGFQTKLKYKEQERVFRKLPGLENAEFLRLGSMHRNTFVDSPRVLQPTLQLKNHPNIFIAGQLTGTEGYLESTATGYWAAHNAARLVSGLSPETLPADTMLGALLTAITDSTRINFQPMNSNMGILPPLEVPIKKDKEARNRGYADRSLHSLKRWKATESLGVVLEGYKPESHWQSPLTHRQDGLRPPPLHLS
jgi:methylenetetrahydrofolate--tRNA-(uracil-5-)-methyltransferase